MGNVYDDRINAEADVNQTLDYQPTSNPTRSNDEKQKQDSFVSINSINIYEFMDNAYFGTGGFRDGTFLKPHKRENFYVDRQDLAHYRNYYKAIVDATITPIFRDDVIREVNDSALEKFTDDATNSGASIQDVVENAYEALQNHSISFVLVENFTKEEMPNREIEAEEQRIMPYCVNKYAQDVSEEFTDVDKFGKPIAITFFDGTIEIEKRKVQKYRMWTSSESIEFYVDPKTKTKVIISVNVHDLGRIPIVVKYGVRKRRQTDFLVDPKFYDMARVGWTIYNKDSEIRELERSQEFSIFYAPGNPANLNVGVGASTIMFLGDSTMQPGFASPDPEIIQGLVSNLKELREDMFTIAAQNGVTATVINQESGIAKQWDFQAHESVLKKGSKIATEIEMEILDIVNLYTGKTEIYTPMYPKDFQPNNISEVLDNADKYIILNPGVEGEKAAKKKASKAYLQDQDEETVTKVLEDIDNTSQDEVESDTADNDNNNTEDE